MSAVALTPGVTANVGDWAGCVHHLGAWEMVMARKSFCVFLKSFSLFVIRDIPFLGSPISFFDIPIRPDSGSPNKGFLEPMNTSDFS